MNISKSQRQALVRIARGDEDLVHDAWIKAATTNGYHESKGDVVWYLATAIKYCRLARVQYASRAKRRAITTQMIEDRDGSSDHIEQRIDAYRSFNRLPEHHSLLEAVASGETMEEIGQRTGITKQAVSLRVKKAQSLAAKRFR